MSGAPNSAPSSAPSQHYTDEEAVPDTAPPPYSLEDTTAEPSSESTTTTTGSRTIPEPHLTETDGGSGFDDGAFAPPAAASLESAVEPRRYLYGIFTFEEVVVFMIYPITIVLGSLVSAVSQPHTYFSSKRNFFNVTFVKNGWFWTTIVYMVHCSRLRISKPTGLFMRYAVATLWWYLFTQWFLGAPLMDRVFLGTGGTCRIGEGGDHKGWTSVGCRHASGEWTGGHDISGHSFLLTHASLFLWYEILPVCLERGPMMRQANTKIVMSLLLLWWWMLLMTGIYFHTFQEKVTGWLMGLVAWAFLYVAVPRVPALKRVFSVPGV